VFTTVKKKKKASRYFKANNFHSHPLLSFPTGKNDDFVHNFLSLLSALGPLYSSLLAR
jgi:hypothetical protein